MNQAFRLFVLQKLSSRSHNFIGELQPAVDAPSEDTLESLEQAVRDHIKSREEFKSWTKGVDNIHFVVHKVGCT